MKTRKLFTFLVVVALMFGGLTMKPAPAKAIKNFTVEVTPNVVGEVAEYKFQFTIEKKINVHDWITFVFPKGTKLIPPLPEDEKAIQQRLKDVIENIQFCAGAGSPNICAGLPTINFEKDGSMLIKFGSWLVLDPARVGYEDLCMIINKKAGIANPTKAGIYIYQISTQAEPTLVESQPVEIKEQGIKSHLIDVNPKTTNTAADYTFQFTFLGNLKASQGKGFFFPPGTTLNPPMPEEETAKMARLKDIANAFSFGDRESLVVERCGLPIVEYIEDGYLNIRLAGGTEGLLIPDVPDGKTITMHFSKKAGICTPSKPGSYVYKFNTMLCPIMESQPIEITAKEKDKEDKPDLPDTINANVWFSNSVKGDVTNMLIHIPLEVSNLCCFELRLMIPLDKLDMNAYFSKGNVTREDQDFFLEHVFLNGKTLKESTTSASRISGISENGKLYLEIVPTIKNLKQIDLHFDKALQIKLLQEGILTMTDSRIFVSSTAYKNGGKEIKLIFPDNYIFPGEK